MMQPYLRDRSETERKSKLTGLAATALVHAAAVLLVSFSGFNYLYPPPEESSMLLDFTEEEIQEIKPVYGREPQGEDVDLEKEVELVQRSESPNVSTSQNLTPATKDNSFGDVETPAPERKEEPRLDPRATFPGMAAKDTSSTTPHSATEASNSFKAGPSNGNSATGKESGVPNAHVEGRKVNKSTLAKPHYDLQESGIVVVKIWVDQYGNVKRAEPGADGTTISSKKLWAEARAVALKAHFDQKADAPAMQEGTITYIFNLQ